MKQLLLSILFFTVFICGSVSANQLSSRLPGLIGLWHFEEGTGSTVRDELAQCGNGTIGTAAWVSGKFGKGLSFTGATTSKVTMPNTTATRFTDSTPFTLSAWVCPLAGNASAKCFMSKNTGADNALAWTFWWDPSNSSVRIYMPKQNAVAWFIYGPANKALLNKWSYVVFTFDGTTGIIYINGIPGTPTNKPYSGAYADTSVSLTFGNDNSNPGNSIKGVVDDIAIYNRALKQAEIQHIYLMGIGRYHNE